MLRSSESNLTGVEFLHPEMAGENSDVEQHG